MLEWKTLVPPYVTSSFGTQPPDSPITCTCTSQSLMEHWWENVTLIMKAQQGLRSACTSGQSDQSLLSTPWTARVQALFRPWILWPDCMAAWMQRTYEVYRQMADGHYRSSILMLVRKLNLNLHVTLLFWKKTTSKPGYLDCLYLHIYMTLHSNPFCHQVKFMCVSWFWM